MRRQQAYRYELRPTGAQVRLLARFAGARRYVYNRALQEQERRYAAGAKHLGYAGLCKLITAWRHDSATPWLADMPVHPLQQACRDLGTAYTNFFADRAKHPTLKKKGRSRASFRYPDPAQITLDAPNGRIKLPKLGWLRFRNSRVVQGEVRNVTVSERAGRWFVSVQTEREVVAPVHRSSSLVGIDVGITRFATLSDGTVVSPLHAARRHARQLRRAHRAVSRKVKGSRNRQKAKRRLARVYLRTANLRTNYLHQLTASLSKTHAIIVVEDLQVTNMSASAKGTPGRPGRRVRQKAGLNRSILDQGWGEFRRQLAYKCAWQGGVLVAVPAAHTSQTCPKSDGGCGHIDKENRPTQAMFHCVECGYTNHADLVGALNISAAGRAVAACGGVAQSGAPTKQEPPETTLHAARAAA